MRKPKPVSGFDKAILETIGRRVFEFRRDRHLSVRQLAEAAGLSFARMRNVELAKCEQSLSTMIKIAKVLGVGIGELVEDRARRLTFDRLAAANLKRCEAVFHPLKAWSETDWACAVAGETGEMCNLVKKRRRGDGITEGEVMKELADMVIYADLLAARMGRNLGEAVKAKFNEVSDRRESGIKL